jgi:2'-5' RNA ligase
VSVLATNLAFQEVVIKHLEHFQEWVGDKEVVPLGEVATKLNFISPNSTGRGTSTSSSDQEPSNSMQSNENPVSEKLHISLSRTVALRQHQIDPFIQLLRSSFEEEHSFEASLDGYEVFTNDEHSRSFMSLSVALGKSQICNLIKKVDHALAQFRLPAFYSDGRPHVTIGWVLDDVLPGMRAAAIPTEGILTDNYHRVSDQKEESKNFSFRVDRIQCASGKWVFTFPLSQNENS